MQLLMTHDRLPILQNVTVDEALSLLARWPLTPEFWRACARNGRTAPFPPGPSGPPAQPVIPGMEGAAAAGATTPLRRQEAASGTEPSAAGGTPPAAGMGPGRGADPARPAEHFPHGQGVHPEAPIGLPELVRRVCAATMGGHLAVARVLKVTEAQVRHWQRGRRGPSPRMLNRILVLATDLGVLPDAASVNRITHAVLARSRHLPKEWRA